MGMALARRIQTTRARLMARVLVPASRSRVGRTAKPPYDQTPRRPGLSRVTSPKPFFTERTTRPSATMRAMNVIVVVCNSLHLGFLGAYGNPWIETPNLDRLAAEGIVFDHHFPENLTTLPTRRSWWTGPVRVCRSRPGLDASTPRRGDLARLALGQGRAHGLDLGCPALARSRHGIRPGL